jgi:hypothetical protein
MVSFTPLDIFTSRGAQFFYRPISQLDCTTADLDVAVKRKRKQREILKLEIGGPDSNVAEDACLLR